MIIVSLLPITTINFFRDSHNFKSESFNFRQLKKSIQLKISVN